jgi:hypothetical protein
VWVVAILSVVSGLVVAVRMKPAGQTLLATPPKS